MTEDIKDTMREEGRRGRRPIDLNEKRKARKRLDEMRKLLTLGTEEDFLRAMRAFGIREDSQQFSDALAAWREYR